MEYLKTYIDQQTLDDYTKADALINIFFTILDFGIIMFLAVVYYPEPKHIAQLGHQLIGIFFVDIIIRLHYIYSFKRDEGNRFIKAMISCLFSTDLFFLLLYLYTEVINDLNIQEEINIVNSCLYYVLIAFSYDKIISYAPITFDRYVLSFNGFVLLAQASFSIVFAYYIYDMLKKGIGMIVSIICYNEKVLRPIHKFFYGAPFICFLLYIFYFNLKIWLLFCRSPILLLNGNMITGILKDGAKYFALISCLLIVRSLNRLETREIPKKVDLEETQNINI